MGLFDRVRNAVTRPVTGAIAEPVNAVRGLVDSIGNQIRGTEPVDLNTLAELEAESIRAQAAVNEKEAQHTSVFVAGWRPFIGWVCGVGVAMEWVVRPAISWIFGADLTSLTNLGQLIALLGAMLGVAGLRTYEKITDTSGNH